MTNSFSISDAIGYGLSKFGEERGYCLALIASAELVCLVSSAVIANQFCLISQVLTQIDARPPEAFLCAFIPVYVILRACAQVPVNKALLMLHDGGKLSLQHILGFDFAENLSSFMRMIAATIAFGLSTTFLSFLFVLPGLFASSTLRFFKFSIVATDCDAIEGLRDSYEIGGNSKTALIGFNVATSAIRVLGLLCFGVGYIPASAVCGLAEAYAYRRLSETYQFEQACRAD